MILRYFKKDFVIILQDGVLTIHCKIDGKSYNREYKLPYVVDHVTCDGDYMRILFADEDVWYQLKLEDEHGIIGDIFNHIDSDFCEPWAMHCFLDDIEA